MVTFVGLLLMCLAVLAITFTSTVYIVFLCYAVFGIGNGMIHLSGMVICSEYFDKVYIYSVILLTYLYKNKFVSISNLDNYCTYYFHSIYLNFSVGHWQLAFV